MFSRSVKASKLAQISSRRFYSANHGHGPEEPKVFEVTVTKVLGVVAVVGGCIMYAKSESDNPVIKTPLYKEQDQRSDLRNQNYERRYKAAFIKQLIRDNGGIGNAEHRQASEYYNPTTIIPPHSPYGYQFGAGIDTSSLGPRKQLPAKFAPLPASE